MPLYSFRVSGLSIHHDSDGIELADDDAAWSMALVSMGELLKDLHGKMSDSVAITTTVSDADGQTVLELRLEGARSS